MNLYDIDVVNGDEGVIEELEKDRVLVKLEDNRCVWLGRRWSTGKTSTLG